MPEKLFEQKNGTDRAREGLLPENKNLFLIGFMGSGKSAVSRTLKKEYGFEILEMDEEIEKRQGMPISEIFRVYGEEAFRKMETDLLEELKQKSQTVISCGGGTPMWEENVKNMRECGRIVLLTAKPETILQRVSRSHNRPLLKGNKNIAYITELMEKRKDKYNAAADILIHTDDKSREEICREILEKAGGCTWGM